MKSTYSPNALKRWSCKSKDIPGASGIRAVHVYDFDNTLFSSPLPNPQIWSSPAIGMLQAYETLAYGGWWHDSSILAATGDGLEKEEPRAWEGWWNETIVQLVEMSIQSRDVVTVLLTGRGETNFTDLVNRICNAKNLDFDLVVLKPEVGPAGQRFESTMSFKQEFLRELVFTYKNAEEIRIYEDRPKHVKGFRDYFERLNKSLLSHPADQPPPVRKPITSDVVHVCELRSSLNPETEVNVVQKAINRHNHAVANGGPNPTKSVRRQLKIVEQKDLIKKVGGRGKKVTWQVTGFTKYEDRIWAARVAPVSETQIYTQDPTPLVVLAIRKGSRQIDAAKIHHWESVAPEKAFMFETTVGDKVMLKIEESDFGRAKGGRKQDAHDGTHKRKHINDESDLAPQGSYARVAAGDRDDGTWAGDKRPARGGRFSQRNAISKANFNNRGNHGNSGNRHNMQDATPNPRQRGGGPGAGGGNRGRNAAGANATGGHRGPPGYKSLDDYGPGNFDGANDTKAGSGEMVMNY
ncbi:hypothetical protein LTR40_000338 [Exophiala xenobiotica]|nr:hypothetical protein LTR40_000338 [Exophiala xenobiotica]